MDKEISREIILENFQNPFHKEEVKDENYIKVNTRNPNCIDNIDLYILFKILNLMVKPVLFLHHQHQLCLKI